VSRKIEDEAKTHLLTKYMLPRYSFKQKGTTDKGFDLWMFCIDESPRKVELKAHTGVYRRPSHLLDRLIFNSDVERELFESGETVIVRVFLGEKPIRVFVMTNEILGLGAKLTSQPRFVVRGKINYLDTSTELT